MKIPAGDAYNNPYGYREVIFSSLLNLPLDKLVNSGKDALERFFDMSTGY